MNKEFIEAIGELEAERGISKEMLFEAIESALVSAYKKNYGTNQNVSVDIDKITGDINVYMSMDVVEEIEDDSAQISLEEAQEIDPAYEVGDVVEYMVTPKDFGRIAAQTAKQVVVQRIREAERTMIFDDFIDRAGEVVTGIVQRNSNGTLFVSVDKTEGILPLKEQVPGEHFEIGERIKVYIMDVKRTTKGPQVFLSRSHPGLVKRLFELEVPEIREGVVEIKSIAREAGSRTKMAVKSLDEKIDPIGACVGPKGSRVKNIVDELGDEKIDIIKYSDDYAEFISASLSPSKVVKVEVDEEEKSALVVVPDYQLSLAIGKDGQNARLAAKLTGWKIDIKSESQYEEDLANGVYDKKEESELEFNDEFADFSDEDLFADDIEEKEETVEE